MHYYEWDGVTKLGDVWLRDWNPERLLAGERINELQDQERMLRGAFQRLIDTLDLQTRQYQMIDKYVPLQFGFIEDDKKVILTKQILAEIKFICELTDDQAIILKLRVPQLAAKETMYLDEDCPL